MTEAPGSFFGHPRGLATLFFTEMWERFTFYGLRALLVLFLVDAVSSGGYGFDDRTATAVYGLYTAAVFMAALPGGWIADRLIGAQRAVLAGGALMTLGSLMLAIPGPPASFFAGLAVIVIGVGLLKPNVSTLVAGLYPEGGGRRDALAARSSSTRFRRSCAHSGMLRIIPSPSVVTLRSAQCT